MQKILVTGANGQMGREFAFLADRFPAFRFAFLDRAELDICDKKALVSWFEANKVDYCINCAAYTAVDKAESEAGPAREINVTAVANLGKICAGHNIPVIHFSTDYVYHTTQNTPFKETDATHPQGVYAATKLEGELQLLASNPLVMVIRTSWVYSTFGQNFVKTMLRLGKERDHLSVVADQIGTPTNARDLAKAVLQILANIESGKLDRNQLSGIFNYSNEGVCSWYDFAQAIFEMTWTDCTVKPIASADYPTPAMRPPFSVLDKTKFKTTFEMEIPHWRKSLESMLSK